MTRKTHFAVGGIALAVLLLSVFLEPGESTVGVMGWDFPPLCAWKQLLGWRCLGCGLTRSFVYMGHGQWLEAFRMHWLGPLGWLLVVSQVPWRAWLIWSTER